MKKRGGQSPVYMCISTCTLGESGGMLPQKILHFRLSETASGASQELCIEQRIFNLEAIVAIHRRLAISKGGQAPPPHPPPK